MTRIEKNTLSDLTVRQAMRRQVIQLPQEITIANSIIAMIKYKINALLAIDSENNPIGVLSKTDIMGAYYAGLPIESSIEDIISRPPLFCSPEDGLETSLQIMHDKGIYRLYVTNPETGKVLGALAYPDIVGLLYQHCRDCEYNHLNQKRKLLSDTIKRFAIHEIMSREVHSVEKEDSLFKVMEILSAYRFGAILVNDKSHNPSGVISKTDLTLAYKHGIDTSVTAETIMTSPVQSCNTDDFLENAIRKMVFSDVHRLFVHQNEPKNIVGVISLSDAARIRSGSCYACISSRIKLES